MLPYLGDLLLYWCRSCNLPVLGKTCACGASTEKVDITPPGDIRPAFEYDIDLINRTTQEHFGARLVPEGRLVVLNKAPYEDRMDEVIFDGVPAGSIRFELEKMGWVFIPRLPGAARLAGGGRGWVMVDRDAVDFIVKGASVLAPGVMDADPGIVEGDEVIVLTPQHEVIAAGRAKMDAARMLTRERGMAVKTRWNGLPAVQVHESKERKEQKEPTWSDAVSANLPIIERFEEKAHKFIKNVSDTVKKPVTVSYSGGKDSLATLMLVKDVIQEFQVLFADTGLEFPETVENVREITNKCGMELVTLGAGEKFWEAFDIFGPPTVEARWCCKVCKLGLVTRLIEDNYSQSDGCLTFVGQRRYESEVRANSEAIWKNPWVGNQIAASPIQNWTALHVWLYLFRKKAQYNVLYEQGFDRIGCWLCPSTSMADLQRIQEMHPELWKRLDGKLSGYASRMGYPGDWRRLGLWRWQSPPKAIRELMGRLGISISCEPGKKLPAFSSVSGIRPCTSGGVSAEGSFGVPLNLHRIEESGMLSILGKVSSTDGVSLVSCNGDTVSVFASGMLVARSGSRDGAAKLLSNAEKLVRRASGCTGCGICVGACLGHAVEIGERAKVTAGCTQCGKCLTVCPVVKFT